MTDQYLSANRDLWDQWTTEHEKSPFYDLAGFKAGRDRLRSIELTELGDVAGKSLLHLQCHFGLDTLAWARRGALVTGTDLSEKSIELACALSAELDIPATFVCCDLYELPEHLSGEFDIVFTSYGVLHWLRDLPGWARIIARFLKPNGIFYIVEDHPTFRMFTTAEQNQVKLANPYFHSAVPEPVEMTGSYATDNQGQSASFYIWNHGLGEILTALIEAGLSLEFLHEFPYAARAKFPFMVQGPDGWWRLPEGYVQIPFLFSLQARKPIQQNDGRLEAAARFAIDHLQRTLIPAFTYHNLEHTVEVARQCGRLAELEGVDAENRRLLMVAAYFHELGLTDINSTEPAAFEAGRAVHERRAAEIAREVLPGLGFEEVELQLIERLILATTWGQARQSLLEQIIADADLSSLGQPLDYFMGRSEALRAELAAFGNEITEADWYEDQVEFVSAHTYYTESARQLFDANRLRNVEAVRARLETLLSSDTA